MSKPSSSSLTPSAETSSPRLDLDAVLDCSFGNYPWDDGHRHALARGLSPELAGLGRLLIREAYPHDWTNELKSLCGWSDDGQALLALALRAPRQARRQGDILMRTDGWRGDYPSPTAHWTWGFLKPDARRLLPRLSTLNHQPTHGLAHS